MTKLLPYYPYFPLMSLLSIGLWDGCKIQLIQMTGNKAIGLNNFKCYEQANNNINDK